MRSSKIAVGAYGRALLILVRTVEAWFSALQLLDEVNQVLQFNPVIRRVRSVFFVERKLMQIRIVEELLEVSELKREAAVDRAVDAADAFGRDRLKNVDVRLDIGPQAQAMDAINGLQVVG